eukprot:TRINITY_DN251_c0_g1_i3.p1 TRINITY_DN251_c0_g1~~TRINITY_DN251_c0_g1_i3.p1  ORF type:complete len:628 (-),score=83.28 TRINITY_DN251_c0_g1_i3:76-1959(-)
MQSDYKILYLNYNGIQEEMAVVEGQTRDIYDESVRYLFGIPKETTLIYFDQDGDLTQLWFEPEGSILNVVVHESTSEDGWEQQFDTDTSHNEDPVPLPPKEVKERAKSEPKEEKKELIPVKVIQKQQESEPKEEKKELIPVKVNQKQQDSVPKPPFEEPAKQPVSIVFLGHVAVGKSTICGNIMATAGKVSPRTIKENTQKAKENNHPGAVYAYIMDTNEEEQVLGNTIEVGCTTFETETKNFTIYDTPGHQDYVANMITGAAMADVGVLVVSAKRGDFEAGLSKGGRTVEHILLAKALGIQELIVLINKMDEPTVNWSQERYEKIKHDLSLTMLRYGFNKEAYWIPLSGLSGANVFERVDPLVCDWYKGSALMEVLDGLKLPKQKYTNTVRISVFYKYTPKSVFVKIHSGWVKVGAKLAVMPSKTLVEVTAIKNADEEPVPYAIAGENVILELKNKNEELRAGCILCNPEDSCITCRLFMADLKVVDTLKHKPIVTAGYKCMLHLQALVEQCTIVRVFKPRAGSAEEGKLLKEQRFARKEENVRCIIATDMPIAVEKFKIDEKGSVKNKFGRFILRDEGKTIAVGVVTRYKPEKLHQLEETQDFLLNCQLLRNVKSYTLLSLLLLI